MRRIDRYKDLNIKTVFTIHNLRFQGKLNVADFVRIAGLSGKESWMPDIIHYDQANLMKAALYNADTITTVSPNYAKEIEYAYYGETLEGCVADIRGKLHGIINGIDEKEFDPRTDTKIYKTYTGLEGQA